MEEKVSDVFVSLTKAIKAFQMYGITHPSFKNFYTPFYQKMINFLKEYSTLNFQIERFAILHSNRVIYEEKEKDASIAFRLFRDGIRDINFYDGLTEHELLLFLETISQPAREQDIALNLWDCDFAHINFYVVEEEEELMTYKIPDTPALDVDYDVQIAKIIDKEKIDITNPVTPNLSFDELKSLKTEIFNDEKKSLLPMAITVLINFLNTDKSPEIINSLSELLEFCINNQDFYNARRIMHKLASFPGITVLEKFENEATIMSFKNFPDALNDKIFNEFIAFIGFFSKKTVPFFIRIISEVKRKERLESLRQRIAYICQDDLTPIVAFLKSENIQILINAISILGIMRLKETTHYLETLFNHPELTVRNAVVQTLSNIDELPTVAKFLDDQSQDIRIKVLQILAQNKYSKIYPELLSRIKTKDFRLLDFTEQKEFFNCLVANGDNKLAKHLEKILFKFFLFGGKSYRDMRRLAALSLAQISSDESFKILQTGIRKKNKDIKLACESAFTTVSRRERTK